MTKEQAKGYLYEIFIAHLLKQNSFLPCKKNNNAAHQDNVINDTLKCGVVSEKGELEGRGTKHQIDFTGVYSKNIPFIYPIRILTECKYWTKNGGSLFKPVDKSFIREYIGVYKDISENYHSNDVNEKTRFLDIPIIFSAGGFDDEAEVLAWAQGINLVSHSQIPILRDVLLGINYLIENVPAEYYRRKTLFPFFKEMAQNLIENKMDQNGPEANRILELLYENISNHGLVDENEEDIESDNQYLIEERRENYIDNFILNLKNIRVSRFPTFLFGTTEYGKLINLISYDEFPDELFAETDEVTCKMLYYKHEDEIRLAENDALRTFFIQMDDDDQAREFYFQGNKTMMGEGFDEWPEEDRITEKLNFFKELSIIKEINGLTRVIKLKVYFRGRE